MSWNAKSMESGRITVLAIEDDPADAALLRRHIESITACSINLIVRENSMDGLNALSEYDVDLVLLDYMLGAETGLTTMQAIRSSNKDLPVVFLTGRGDEQVAVEVFKAGAADYLPKHALSPISLQRAITNAVEKSRLQQLIERHRDQLERKAADLARRNREIGAFYHTVSHELKTPLTSIHSFLSIVLDGLAGEINGQQREYLHIAKQGAEQMTRCINDLVDATRLETGKLSVEPQELELGALCESVLSVHGARAAEAGVELRAHVPAQLPDLHADPERISQVLFNLVGNALKFTPAGGRVTVAAERDSRSDMARVTVTDTGRGIPAGHLERIFDRLHQVEEDDCATAGGLGLGLYICKEIVELHGGRISAESEVGSGTAFSFTLPLHASARVQDTAGSTR